MTLDHAGQSIPKCFGRWSDIMGAYRLLSNEAVDAQEIQRPHRALTRSACQGVVLAVADVTDLDFTPHPKTKGLGKIGDGRGRGLQQHTVLAVAPGGGVLGVFDQRWYVRPEPPEGETRRQRQSRWCVADVWADAVRAIGPVDGCRVIHVADRAADSFATIDACFEQGVGFLIRAMHDRTVGDDHLWATMAKAPVLTRIEVKVSARRAGLKRDQRVERTAQVSVRTGTVEIKPPRHDPRSAGKPARTVNVVYLREEDAPSGEGVQAIDWMLLTSEEVATAADATRLAGWYAQRWTIEEFHRVEKEGCSLEASQLDDAQDLMRLAAVTAVVAVRLLQMRDLASGEDADDPAALHAAPEWIAVVAALAGVEAETLTPRRFWRTIARQGGWIGRTSDPRPGWKVIWRGWYDISLMVRGALLANALRSNKRCV